ncbi:MAG: translation initiation factor IF-2 [Candidatus Marinimicrobia bacterium]|nr:translation initiation factor IF-2 [Candidatus Neomarinimicrobiota bacterium]
MTGVRQLSDVLATTRRIVQVAKDLNISHRDIIEFLNSRGLEVKSHMSPLGEGEYQLVIEEFEKDLQTVERYRKEKTRKEIHSRMIEEKMNEGSSLEILMPDEAAKFNDQEAIKEELEAAPVEIDGSIELDDEEITESVEEEFSEEQATDEPDTTEPQEEDPELSKRKPKFRKVDLSKIQSQIETPRRRPEKAQEEEEKKKDDLSVSSTIKRTLAAMEHKAKKKRYRKDRDDDEELELEEVVQTIQVRDFMNVQELAEVLDVSPTDIIGNCLQLGIIATMNQRLEFDTLSLLADEYGYKAELIEEEVKDFISHEEDQDDGKSLKPRAPVVTIMGHVDHGKTSLIDYIRRENVVAGEAGGITQHIGAYEVFLEEGGRSVTFLDTPGHEAFTAMRARGAQVTDVVILIVAADDGVKPQTIEAIDHAKAAGVPIVVAVNKIDKPNSNPDIIKKELSENGILVEDWGGKVQCVSVSAKTGDGIPELLELLALETEVLDLKANRDTLALGTVIESKLDKGHGAIATVLVQRGTLHQGEVFICGNHHGKVRALMNERGTRIESAGPSQPVQILGFQTVPQAGDIFTVVEDEKKAKKISGERDRIQREIDRQKIHTISLDKLSTDIREGASKLLPLVVKADVDGSIEALVDALSDIPSKEVKVDVVHRGVGIISESDVLLAAASGGVVIGFNVSVNPNASLVAKNNGIDIRVYSVIYDAINEIKLALEGLLEPDIVEKPLGQAEVLQAFKISRLGTIAGCKMIEGAISRKDTARIRRDGEVIYEGKITSLKHFQDDVKEIDAGKECGIGIEGMKNFEEGDLIETYTTEEVKRTLEA